jgi:hypothetical protein
MKTNFKLINFPEAKKRIERRQFWQAFWSSVASKFKRKVGFDKYVIVSWGIFSDTHRAWVCVQNKDTGKAKHHDTGIYTINDDAAWKAITLFVGKLK